MVRDKDETISTVTEGLVANLTAYGTKSSGAIVTLDDDVCLTRRALLLGMLAGGLQLAASTTWSGAPPHAGEMATLYGGLDQPGLYLVLMKWYPGYMSAPHSYATDRLSLVMSGTWWVNSGSDFDPDSTVPVPAGGFVRRVADTPHYDGVKKDVKQPAVIALFGTAPVQLKLVDPGKPSWRKV